MEISVEIKSVYGAERIYPMCEKGKIFAKLVGQATLTQRDINYIKQLDYTVRVVSSNPNKL